MNRSLRAIFLPPPPNNLCGSQGDVHLTEDLSDAWAALSVIHQGELTDTNMNKLLLGKNK